MSDTFTEVHLLQDYFHWDRLSDSLSFGFCVLVGRFLGAGAYYLTFTVAAIASIIGLFGLNDALLRFTVANTEHSRLASSMGR